MNEPETRTVRVDRIEALERELLRGPQLDCPVTHTFSSGLYWREMEIPKGVLVIGHKHKTEHLNVMLTGKLLVLCEGKATVLTAPQVFTSPAGVRKIGYALETTRWANALPNPNDERDVERLENMYIEKSITWLEHQAELKQLAQAAVERSLCLSQQ